MRKIVNWFCIQRKDFQEFKGCRYNYTNSTNFLKLARLMTLKLESNSALAKVSNIVNMD